MGEAATSVTCVRLGRRRTPMPATRTDRRLTLLALALLSALCVFTCGIRDAVAVTAQSTTATTTQNTAVAINLSQFITTTFGGPSVSVSSGPSHGTTSVSGLIVTYTPASGFSGTDSFQYTASAISDTPSSASATVTITVTAPSSSGGSSNNTTTTTTSLDNSVYGTIGAIQQTAVFTALGQLNSFNRHLEDLNGVLRQHRPLGVAINGQTSTRTQIASIASMLSPNPMIAQDALRGGLPAQTAQASSSPGPEVPIELPDRIGIFVNGNLSLRTIGSSGAAPSASPRTMSLSAGADYRLNPDTIIGIGAGYSGNTTDIGGGSKTSSNAFNFTLYGSTRPLEPVYIDAQASYGHVNLHSQRDLAGSGFAIADPNANQFWGSLTGGYEFDSGPYTFGPYLRADGSHSQVDGFTERGASTLTVTASAQTVDSVEAVLGFRGDRAFSTEYGIVSPHVRAEYLHEFIGASESTVGFANGAATGFTVNGYPVAHNYFSLGTGVSFLTENALTFFADYEALVGYTHQTSHSITIGGSMRF